VCTRIWSATATRCGSSATSRVYLTTPDGERELVVARGSAREDDARELAAAVAAAVAQTP
jgi:hypothetical protein